MLIIRREILYLIKDHPECTFDFIYRHFLTKKPSTIHYHLRMLLSERLIQKFGTTRGVVYAAV